MGSLCVCLLLQYLLLSSLVGCIGSQALGASLSLASLALGFVLVNFIFRLLPLFLSPPRSLRPAAHSQVAFAPKVIKCAAYGVAQGEGAEVWT